MAKPTGELHEELLVLRAKARDAAALAELVQCWHARLLAHAQRLTRDPDGAEEAVQEAWMAIVRGIGGLKEPGGFAFWAQRIVGRECANWVHRRQRVRRDGSAGALAQAMRLANPEAADSTGALRTAMDGLSVEHREVLVFHYLQKMSVEQIAVALRLSAGTIKSRLHYAREAMRRAMSQEAVKSNE
jgi:RNA polymerase sigma factor (sigma-70 family)